MAKLSLKAKLDALSKLTFAFADVTRTKDRDGHMIAILQLTDPIPLVRGSQEVEFNGSRVPISAKDVREIKIHESNFNDDFEFDSETNAGKYEGSELILDVSKQGQAWLVKTSFAQAGNTFRTEANNARLGKLLGIVPTGTKPPADTTNQTTGKGNKVVV